MSRELVRQLSGPIVGPAVRVPDSWPIVHIFLRELAVGGGYLLQAVIATMRA